MKYLNIIISSVVILVLLSGFGLYFWNITTVSYSVIKNTVPFIVPYPSTDPMLYLTNKAMVCYYLGWNTVSGGRFKDVFDFDYINTVLRPVSPTGSFSFSLKWDGAQVTSEILNVDSPELAHFILDILKTVQANKFKENAEFEATVTMNYKAKYVKVFIKDFIGHSPNTDGVVKMKDILPDPNCIYKLIPYLPMTSSANYAGKF